MLHGAKSTRCLKIILTVYDVCINSFRKTLFSNPRWDTSQARSPYGVLPPEYVMMAGSSVRNLLQCTLFGSLFRRVFKNFTENMRLIGLYIGQTSTVL